MTALERGKTLREAPTCDDQVDRGGAADFLLRRVDEAAKHLPVDQLTISPQCGISCDIELVQLPKDVRWRKFQSLLCRAGLKN